MPNPVVVTRPLAQAKPLAARISRSGRRAIIFPLLEIHALPDPAPLHSALEELERYSLVAFVSPNAIHAAFSRLPFWPREVAIGVVGEGSRAALAEHGISAPGYSIYSPVSPERSDSEGLLAALDMEKLRGKPVLIIRGETGRELLADELRAGGMIVEAVAAYRRSMPAMNSERKRQLSDLLESEHDWLITSSEAMRNLGEMVEQIAGVTGVQNLQQQRFFVPHVRIEAAARELGLTRLILTQPGDAGLLAALQCAP